MRALEQIDPDHIAFVNMLSTTGEFLRIYMKVVEPPMLSFDYYQVVVGQRSLLRKARAVP